MDFILIFICIFLISFIFSMFGMGGGLFFMPFFLAFYDHHHAALYSFIAIFVTSASSMLAYHRKKLIDWKLVLLLGLPLILMVFLTGIFINIISLKTIKVFLSCTLIFAGIFMLNSFPKKIFF